jgi:hypothetical protein
LEVEPTSSQGTQKLIKTAAARSGCRGILRKRWQTSRADQSLSPIKRLINFGIDRAEGRAERLNHRYIIYKHKYIIGYGLLEIEHVVVEGKEEGRRGRRGVLMLWK